MRMYNIIKNKRDNKELSAEEITFFINGYCNKEIPDYQAAALLMAIYFNGMTTREISILTGVMSTSGDTIDLSPINGFKVDKHSTGGVGDKTTLIVGPIVATCGCKVAKMSGRGLGHTGGTIDKLESIPGFNVEIGEQQFFNNINKIGIAISSQTGNLAPADKLLYSLRDVTATVDTIPLIASSIMSKKIASGADGIVLDVKTGSGAFMNSFDESIELAKTMVDIGESNNKKTIAIITDMNVPLGSAIGNSLEVIEAINVLKNKSPQDIYDVSIEISARMIQMSKNLDYNTSRNLAINAVESGEALEKFKEMIEYQNGNSNVISNPQIFGESKFNIEVKSQKEGYISEIDTEMIGIASVVLGAGREKIGAKIDYNAGIKLHKKTGEYVNKGELLASIYSDKEDKINEGKNIILEAYKFSNDKQKKVQLILATVTKDGVEKY